MTEQDGATLVAVRLTPRASREEIVGPRGDSLAVKVSAPPVDDRANAEAAGEGGRNSAQPGAGRAGQKEPE
jgi:uncharacterized protein YggU (UPF0235/DUF167 family)